MRFPANGSEAIKIHNHAWSDAQAKLESEFLSLKLAALGIRPCKQQDIVDQTDVCKHPILFPYSQQSYHFAPEELPNLFASRA